jgi:hypothetical protein
LSFPLFVCLSSSFLVCLKLFHNNLCCIHSSFSNPSS